MWSTLAYLVFRKIKSPTYCAKAQEYTLAHCLLAPLKKFPSSDANPVQSPLEELCAPCVPSGTWGNHPHSAVPQNRQAPWLPSVGPVWPVSIPGGERPVPARSGAGLGHTGPSLAERKENDPARKAVASADGEYASVRLPIRLTVSPKTSSGERCEKQAGERPGVAGASPAGSPRPAEPVVPGFLPGPTTRKIRGRLGGLGVTTGVRNTKFPGGKPFFRVSPPGSTKG